MVFVLKSHQAPGKRVVKLLLRELDEALAAFAREPFTGKEIHAVRRCGKRSRALLRLDRRALPPGGYEREENCWRKVGQSLGPVRDAEVLGNTVVRLRQHYATQISAGACESVRERFLRRKERALQAVRGRVPRLIRELTAARTRISRWRLKQD